MRNGRARFQQKTIGEAEVDSKPYDDYRDKPKQKGWSKNVLEVGGQVTKGDVEDKFPEERRGDPGHLTAQKAPKRFIRQVPTQMYGPCSAIGQRAKEWS